MNIFRACKYIRDVCILHKRVGVFEKKRFGYFGKGSYLEKPLSLIKPDKIRIGSGVSISNGARLEVYSDFDEAILIGDNTSIMYNASILSGGRIEIGKNVLIASDVLITSENHGIDPEIEVSYVNQPLNMAPVIIGDNVWIGEKAIILPGVTIGKACIIGAGSVVTKSIPNYSIAVGNPARVIKEYNFETHSWEAVQ